MSVPAVNGAASLPPSATPSSPGASAAPGASAQMALPFMLLLPAAAAPPANALAATVAAEAQDSAQGSAREGDLNALDATVTDVDEAAPLIGWLFDSFALSGEAAPLDDAGDLPRIAGGRHAPSAPSVAVADGRPQAAIGSSDTAVEGASSRATRMPPTWMSEPALTAAPASKPGLSPPNLPPVSASEVGPDPMSALTPTSPAFAMPPPMSVTPALANSAVPSPPPPMPLYAERPDLGAALGERISWQLQQGLGEATIELHPAELGALTIRIETQAQQAQVHILAAEPAARALLSQCLPQLRELLGASGLTLTKGQVESGERRGGQGSPGTDGISSPRGARRRVTSVTLVDAYV